MKIFKPNHPSYFLTGIVLLVVLAAWIMLPPILNRSSTSCTTLSAVHGDAVLFGNNEDNPNPDAVIGFFPASDKNHGMVKVGYYRASGDVRSANFEGGMNDQGVAWDALGYPATRLNPHPERPYNIWDDNFLGKILSQADSVADVIKMAENYDFGDQMSLIIHVADASGDAVAIYPGVEGEVVFERIKGGQDHLLSVSKFPWPLQGESEQRYRTAEALLSKIESSNLEVASIETVLESVRQDSLSNVFFNSYTIYSNIFDLTNQVIHLYAYGQYNERVTLELKEELAKGEHILMMADLFPAAMYKSAMESFQQLQQNADVLRAAILLAVLAAITTLAVLLVRGLRRRSQKAKSGILKNTDVSRSNRLKAVDALRGLIIVFMALDHANFFIAQQHSPGEYWGGAYPVYDSAAPFLTRFVTHFCAPGFFFLMGVGMAMFTLSRQKRGWSRGQVIRHFLLRGILLIGLQLLLVNRVWELSPGGWGIALYFGVLYALGGAMILSSTLLWLKPRYLIAISLVILFGTELLVPAPLAWGKSHYIWQNLLFFAGGEAPGYWVNYPILPWLTLATFGLAFGKWLALDQEKTFRWAAGLGVIFLAIFTVLRALNSFGNLRPMTGEGWMDFLNPVKYPPSITFILLTMGGNLLFLWLLHWIEKRWPSWVKPLVVFGQAPLFFYILHLFLYAIIGRILSPEGTNIALMIPLWILGLLILYPLCRWYGSFKLDLPENSLFKFI